MPLSLWPFKGSSTRDIGIVGCGQFAFSTVGYFLWAEFGPRIAACYDIDPKSAAFFAKTFRVPRASGNVKELFEAPSMRTLYIVSNHASHAEYGTEGLKCGLDVYLEKPIAVNRRQLVSLLKAKGSSHGRIFAGYNRPFSAALRELRRRIDIDSTAGISLQCFVAGHKLDPSHWYRRPEEGTRVCGNVGHWLDLMVHVLAWRGLPDRLNISIACADVAERDDNISISITSDKRDLLSVMLTSRCEPLEGINETINLQHGDTICKIDDFRRMTIWQRDRLVQRRYWPKDVGHRLAILQPFPGGASRDWHEVELSTLLMLHIADMVREGRYQASFSFKESWGQVQQEMEQQ